MSDYENWLASLQVGDEVCWYSRWHGYRIAKIERITPTRQIKIGPYTFKNGTCGTDWQSRYRLEPVTDKVREAIRYGELSGKVNGFKFTNCTLEQLERVAAIIDEVNAE
jgi:hypothetical protein